MERAELDRNSLQSIGPSNPLRDRVLTGMRTTGKLHLGHYVGALAKWREIQDQGGFESFFLLANLTALTTHVNDPKMLAQSVKDITLDWLSVGLDPNLARNHFVLQSEVPERHELASILMKVTKHGEVMRNPTLKAELLKTKDASMGFMAHPVDQIADIEMISQTPPKQGDKLLVPTGEDQAPLTELARRVVRRFNQQYGPTFVEPTAIIGEVGRLVGPDGKEKMGKSLGNAIYLSDDRDTVRNKVKRMYTDPNRIDSSVPGETEKNPVFVYLRAFDQDKAEIADLTERYQRGGLGDVLVKEVLTRVINDFLDPIRERRSTFAHVDVREILYEGTQAARRTCGPVIDSVREKLYLGFPI